MNVPQLTLNLSESGPLYRQVYLKLKALIVEGHLNPGDRLPS
ncbi:MAG: GntR family transcriptional regulator, partial [Arenibacter algicola]|nr:GntR family transcriptional regulator [Arenibacter algicola]